MKGGWKVYRYLTVFYAYNGPGPYRCFFCAGEVLAWWEDSDKKTSLTVHHKDGSHDNDVPENLAASHASCHSSHHATAAWKNGRVSGLTEAGRAARGRVTAARNRDPEFRKKVSAGKKRWWANLTDEQRSAIGAKISAGHTRNRDA